MYHLSRRSTQQLLREFWGIEISLAAVSSMEARASAALEPAFEQAERAVQGADMRPAFWGLPTADPRRHIQINARAETAHVRPALRDALAETRCMIPSDGF